MTRPSHEELGPKCPLGIEETHHLRTRVAELLEKNSLALCSAEPATFAKAAIATTAVQEKIEQNEREKSMPELYDIENYIAQEKPLKIKLDLDLYQMEIT